MTIYLDGAAFLQFTVIYFTEHNDPLTSFILGSTAFLEFMVISFILHTFFYFYFSFYNNFHIWSAVCLSIRLEKSKWWLKKTNMMTVTKI